jgi:hypothetical protein
MLDFKFTIISSLIHVLFFDTLIIGWQIVPKQKLKAIPFNIIYVPCCLSYYNLFNFGKDFTYTMFIFSHKQIQRHDARIIGILFNTIKK